MKKNIVASLFVGLLFTSALSAQQNSSTTPEKKDLKYALNDDGSHFVKFTFLSQVWLRYNQSNPGTTVFDTPKDQTFDIGLRRTRMQFYGQISDRIFFYTQFGQNNITFNTPRKQGLFFLDALGEINLVDKKLSVGGGLTAWGGPSRYSSPSVGSILSMDAPLYQQTTNDVTDQFLRKLSVYAKGKLGKLDYRLVLSDPMSIQRASAQASTIGQAALFSSEPGKMQVHGYFMYQFKDQESNMLPYTVGSYLGKKDVFNIGAGFVSQQNAMWYLSDSGADTLHSNLNLFSVDVFYDHPLNKEKGTALTAYGAFSVNDYGKNYLRELGVMNPATANSNTASINGSGNAFPAYGSGNVVYVQAGYLCKHDLFKKLGTLQPYAALQYGNYKALADAMVMYELGFNWVIDSYRAKISLNLQNRPVYTVASNGDFVTTARKNMVVLQMQVAI